MAGLDWSECPAVESVSRKRSGDWVFRGTRTPVSVVFENLQDMSVEEVVAEFGVTREQVEAVIHFVDIDACISRDLASGRLDASIQRALAEERNDVTTPI